jgi:hypothetical protein
MATFTDTVRFVVEAVTGSAERNLKSVRGEMAQAEGVSGKLKAGIGQLSGSLTTTLAAGATAGAAAVGAFAAKAIGDFQELALSADKFSAASGLAVEDASRWIEVVGDIGVETETIAGAVNKLNRAAADGKLRELGIETDDANERLLLTLEHLQGITDETARAKAAQELLGKSWTELAPLIESAGSLRDELASVSDAKVINEAEAEKAVKFRDTMDELQGHVEDVTLWLGGALVPAVDSLAGSLEGVAPILQTVVDLVERLSGAMDDLPPPVRGILKGFSRGGPIGAVVGGATETFGWLDNGYPTSNATMAPAGTPGVSAPAGTTTIINNYPPSTDGRETDAALQEYWRKNGRG